MQDANMYSFCVTSDGNIHIVDPVYIRVGNPYQDRLNIGRDILTTSSLNPEEYTFLISHFFPQKRDDQMLLDSIAYGLYASQLPYEGNEAWMDYQQNGLLAYLKYWHTLKK